LHDLAHRLRGLVGRGLRQLAVVDGDEGCVDRFVEHDWPGNARELKNAVERAIVLGETRLLTSPRSGPPASAAATPSASSSSAGPAAAAATAEVPAGGFVIDPGQPYKDQKAAVVATSTWTLLDRPRTPTFAPWSEVPLAALLVVLLLLAPALLAGALVVRRARAARGAALEAFEQRVCAAIVVAAIVVVVVDLSLPLALLAIGIVRDVAVAVARIARHS